MTGGWWDEFSSATWAETVEPKSKPDKVNVTKMLMQMSKIVRREIGQTRGYACLHQAIALGHAFQ
jgi:hypothetical protein